MFPPNFKQEDIQKKIKSEEEWQH